MWRKMRYIWMAGLTGFQIQDSGFKIPDFRTCGIRGIFTCTYQHIAIRAYLMAEGSSAGFGSLIYFS